jgi:hypothetical protein
MIGDVISRRRRGFLLPLASAIFFALAGVAGAQPVTSNMALIQRLYNLPTPPATIVANPTVGTTASQILLADPAAIEVLVVNLSGGNCAVDVSPQVTLTRGILLQSGGGAVHFDFRQDLTLPTEQFWAICTNASSSLYTVRLDLAP